MPSLDAKARILLDSPPGVRRGQDCGKVRNSFGYTGPVEWYLYRPSVSQGRTRSRLGVVCCHEERAGHGYSSVAVTGLHMLEHIAY